MDKKSSKIEKRIEEEKRKAIQNESGRTRRFIAAYDRLNATCRARLDTEGDAIGAYIGRLGAVKDLTYRDELMIRLVRCREIKNKFTRGELSQDGRVISDEDTAALISLEKKVARGKDPVTGYERGERAQKFKRYSHAIMSALSLITITILAVALFFAIKY